MNKEICMNENNFNFWLNQNINSLNSFNMLENKTFCFNGYFVALVLGGLQ